MTILDVIQRLQNLMSRHGNINVQADCPFCGKTFDCHVAVIAPEVVRFSDLIPDPVPRQEPPA